MLYRPNKCNNDAIIILLGYHSAVILSKSPISKIITYTN